MTDAMGTIGLTERSVKNAQRTSKATTQQTEGDNGFAMLCQLTQTTQQSGQPEIIQSRKTDKKTAMGQDRKKDTMQTVQRNTGAPKTTVSGIPSYGAQNGGNAIRISIVSKGQEIPQEELETGFEQLGKQVKDVLQELLGTTQEDLDQAMETLGITAISLVNPNTFAQVMVSLTGEEDVSGLLMNEQFRQGIEQCEELTEELAQELGISTEDLKQLAAQQGEEKPELKIVDTNTTEGNLPQENVTQKQTEILGTKGVNEQQEETRDNVSESFVTESDAEWMADTDTGVEPTVEKTLQKQGETQEEANLQTDQNTEQTVAVEAKAAENGSTESMQQKSDRQTQKMQETPETGEMKPIAEVEPEQSASVQEDATQFGKEKKDGKALTQKETATEHIATGRTEETGGLKSFVEEQQKTTEQPGSQHTMNQASQSTIDHTAFVEETVSDQNLPQLDAQKIIEQVSEFARTRVSADGTTVSMQLNPENLGKVSMQVSYKNGTLTAQIAAQNQEVKELLEHQVAQLQDKMTQQGLKVESIEVTVASHEFEQNQSERDMQNQMQMDQGGQHGAQQNGEHRPRRNLNFNVSDEEIQALFTDLSEDENLKAKVMLEQGNRVDMMA